MIQEEGVKGRGNGHIWTDSMTFSALQIKELFSKNNLRESSVFLNALLRIVQSNIGFLNLLMTRMEFIAML